MITISELRERVEAELINAQAEGVSREACRIVLQSVAVEYDLTATFGSGNQAASAERAQATPQERSEKITPSLSVSDPDQAIQQAREKVLAAADKLTSVWDVTKANGWQQLEPAIEALILAVEAAKERQIKGIHASGACNLFSCSSEKARLTEQIGRLCIRAERAEAERDAFKRDFDAELDGNAAIRKMFGARDDESFFAFIQRLATGNQASMEPASSLRSAAPNSDSHSVAEAALQSRASQDWQPAVLHILNTLDTPAGEHHERFRAGWASAIGQMSARIQALPSIKEIARQS